MNAVAEEVLEREVPLVEYTKTEAELAALEQRLAGVQFDVTTKQGMADARSTRKELVTLRTSLDKLRKEKNSDDQARIAKRNDVAKQITGRIVALEEPIDQDILAEEQRVELEKQQRIEAERQRVSAIQLKIQMLRTAIMAAVGVDSTTIKAKLAEVEATEANDINFGEFVDEAFIAKRDAIEGLEKALTARLAQEADEARVTQERAELSKLQAAEAERQRLAKAEQDERDRIARQESEARQREADEKQRIEREAIDRERAELEEQQAAFARERAEAQAQKDQEAQEAEARRTKAAVKNVSKRTPSPAAAELIKLIARTYTVHEAVALTWIAAINVAVLAKEMGVELNTAKAAK